MNIYQSKATTPKAGLEEPCYNWKVCSGPTTDSSETVYYILISYSYKLILKYT